jgi:hypothetical protein
MGPPKDAHAGLLAQTAIFVDPGAYDQVSLRIEQEEH